ncbi:MAG: 2-oxoglutarate dehydrogenase E1 component [Verrucomicrobiales bacterium]|jgi:2-oxoglutarate dehydrogenase E1 component
MNSSVSARFNADLLDEKFALWKEDPLSVEPTWSAFFEGFELGSAQLKPRQSGPSAFGASDGEVDELDLGRRALVVSMVYNYRILGHSQAWLDPLSREPEKNPRLSLEALGFSASDLETIVKTQFFHRAQQMPLREMISLLEKIYCDRIGFEFMHIHNTEVRDWLRERIEDRIQSPPPNRETCEQRLRWLVEAESFEQFLHRKYVGQKRFGLDGGEALMVSLATILEGCPGAGAERLVMGMAHRGRLNVLANFLRKPLKVILYEFSENYVPNVAMGDGDVKYHLGFETTRETESGGEVAISLAANPSHLEAVNAVVEGKARARQRAASFPIDTSVNRDSIIPILIHGDAAMAGQGTVAEVLNLSQLPGYRTGGTIHIVINNQIGFTTSAEDARSSDYCTDVAKMIEAPIFHVNGDCPHEVAFVSQLALDFRQEYNRDVVIDIVCYRRHGHNEGDEPAFTQPKMYRSIRAHATAAKLFEQQLLDDGILTEQEIAALYQIHEARMDLELDQLKQHEAAGDSHVFAGSSAVMQPPYSHKPVITGVKKKLFREIGKGLTTLPEKFKPNAKLEKRFLEPRRVAVENGGPYNWAFAESLAFGSLLLEGRGVRLSGQDCRRGTFSQRHAVLYDAETRDRYFPLNHLAENEADQAHFCVYNSLLSEVAVLGFDYGYSLVASDMLVLWEAQFGDFINGAQVIIDQFVASAESKWSQPSSIVLLLPHGYEGMGPEHSSARPERFLQLCAEDNIQVCNLTTPAQYFHLLRRQTLRLIRKPLILMTPKSLLGNPICVSREAEFIGKTRFCEFLDDEQLVAESDDVNRLIFCSGKVYYDLLEYRNENKLKNAAIIRVEQFYPFNSEMIEEIVSRYPRANKKWVWCQEEPKNMGAWSFMDPQLQKLADRIAGGHVNLRYAGRARSASPAAGAKAIHVHEQAKLVETAFAV